MQTTTAVPGWGAPQIAVLLLNVTSIAIIIYLVVYWIHERQTTISPEETQEMWLSTRNATIMMAIIAVVAPISINVYPHEHYGLLIYVNGMMWTLIGLSLFDVILDPFIMLASLPFTFLRFLFVYQVHRYLTGYTTRKRTIVIGILSELQTPIMAYLLATIMLLMGYMDVAIALLIPIPILVMVGIIIIRLVPVTMITEPWETAETSGFDNSINSEGERYGKE